MNDLLYMRRALQIAALGRGSVSPNPMVGCVIVHQDRVIGEGWHRHYGGPHAEVNAIEEVIRSGNEALLSQATAYVTLEPCSHVGKTPPCADLLIKHRISRVVVCNDDPNPLVAGAGLERLRQAGATVSVGLLNEEGRALNKRFFTYFEKKRPYILLKWAETTDGFMGTEARGPVSISNFASNRLVHRWRAEEDAIWVGTTTALNDNPRLNVRHWPAQHQPVRIILDRHLRLPGSLHCFDRSQPTICYNSTKHEESPVQNPIRYYSGEKAPLIFVPIDRPTDELRTILLDLHTRKIQSVLVEGGATLLHQLLEEGLWDEIRLCRSPKTLGAGVVAPRPQGTLTAREPLEGDEWYYFQNNGRHTS
jgi:diaminohydroxyphosphoribosylaminopyrimidine deaminase/5-amino-6-(5-phosphoribosylamino)uracil reductase